MTGTSVLRDDEVAVDLFAGGGGWSEGFRWATARSPEIAINHDEAAIAMHEANHPESEHYREDVFHVDPVKAVRGRPVGWLHASPDCRHFSRAKGGTPKTAHALSSRIRGLAWVVVRWAAAVRPRIISLENVAEFTSWCPLHQQGKKAGRPMKRRRGETFGKFVAALQALGYVVEWRELRACDFGAPTSRRRLFVIARRDGEPIAWPRPTHAAPRRIDPRRERRRRRHEAAVARTREQLRLALQLDGYATAASQEDLPPYRTAAECIDWSLPCPSIFGRKKELAPATLRRIAEGVRRFVVESPRPFIVNLTQGARVEDVDEPMSTITAAHRGEKAVVAPVLVANNTNNAPQSPESPLGTITSGNRHFVVAPSLIQTGYGERDGQAPRVLNLHEPLGTVVADGQKHGLVAAYLAKHHGSGERACAAVGQPLDEPMHTLIAKDNKCVVAAHLVSHYGQSIGSPADAPAPSITAGGQGHTGVVAAHMTKLYGTAVGSEISAPTLTVTGQGQHLGLVAAHLSKYYGSDEHGQACDEPMHTVPTKDRFGLVAAFLTKFRQNSVGSSLDDPMPTITSGAGSSRPAGAPHALAVVTVTIDDESYAIADIGMRMLQPRELARAQGFGDDYILTGNKTQQTARIGNSVPPHFGRAIAAANLDSRDDLERAA